METDLTGYLLGCLEPAQRRRIEQQLSNDPELRDQLEQLRQTLSPLATDPILLRLRAVATDTRAGDRLSPCGLAGGAEMPVSQRGGVGARGDGPIWWWRHRCSSAWVP